MVAIVRPKKPYVDWANSLDGSDFTLEELQEDSSAYLLPEIESDRDVDRILKTYFKRICEHKLEGWCLDEKTWPKINELKIFKQWFEVSLHSMVIDLTDQALELEEF